MTINLEILNCAYISDKSEIQELDTKNLVPKMMLRRRLTRAAKIAVYLSNKIDGNNNRIIFGSNYGELNSSATILNNIVQQQSISPTVFQNSVYNTAASYLSILTKNTKEILTISNGDTTAKDLLKVGAVKALDGDEIVLMIIETINIDKIEQLNHCIDYLESAVAIKVKYTTKEPTIKINHNVIDNKYPLSILDMLSIAKQYNETQLNIIEVRFDG